MSIENDQKQQNDEQQILALHEAGDRALMSADLAALARIFADDYVQYNEAGKLSPSRMCWTIFGRGRFVIRRLFPPGARFAYSATLRSCMGRNRTRSRPVESDSAVRYVYLDVLRKCDGEWKLVASQLARPVGA